MSTELKPFKKAEKARIVDSPDGPMNCESARLLTRLGMGIGLLEIETRIDTFAACPLNETPVVIHSTGTFGLIAKGYNLSSRMAVGGDALRYFNQIFTRESPKDLAASHFGCSSCGVGSCGEPTVKLVFHDAAGGMGLFSEAYEIDPL